MKVSLYKVIDLYRNKPLTTTLLPLPHRAEPHTHPPSSPCESPPQNSTDMSSWSSLYTPRLGAESWGILNGMPQPNLQRTNWDIEKTMMKHDETCSHTSQGSQPNFPQHARKPVPCRTCVLQIDLPWPLKNQYEYRTNSTPAPKRSLVNFWGSMMINGSIWLKPQVPCQANNWSNQPGIPPAPQRLAAVQPLSFPPPAAVSPRHPGGMMIPGLLVCAALRILNIAWPWLNYIYIHKCIIII